MQIVDILGQLVPNVWTALSQLCATAVLFFLMYRLAWKPVKRILDQRSEYEQSRLEEAERLKQENETINTRAKEIIADANREAEKIVKAAREEGEEARRDIITEANAKSAQILEDAGRQARLQHEKAMKDMHGEIVDVAISAAEKMLQDKVDEKDDKSSIEAFIREIITK